MTRNMAIESLILVFNKTNAIYVVIWSTGNVQVTDTKITATKQFSTGKANTNKESIYFSF